MGKTLKDANVGVHGANGLVVEGGPVEENQKSKGFNGGKNWEKRKSKGKDAWVR